MTFIFIGLHIEYTVRIFFINIDQRQKPDNGILLLETISCKNEIIGSL